jgi:hypothetical protein
MRELVRTDPRRGTSGSSLTLTLTLKLLRDWEDSVSVSGTYLGGWNNMIIY